MENATKALLIAGSILIVIIIIGFGVAIVNQGDSLTQRGSETLNEMEIQAFNAKFTIYEGKQNASSVKALLEKIDNSNSVLGVKEGELRYVGLDSSGTITSTTASVPSTTNYYVTFEKDSNQLICTVKITKQ